MCESSAITHETLFFVHTERDLDSAAMKSKDYKGLAGGRIKAAREAMRDDRGDGYSQAAFAKLIPGMKAARLGNYESGTRYPGPEVFEAIGAKTGEPAAYLAGLVDGEAAELLRAFQRMEKAEQQYVLHVCRRSPGATEVKEFGIDVPQPPPRSKKPAKPQRKDS